MRAETAGALPSSLSLTIGEVVVVVDARKRLGEARAGPMRTASVCSSTTVLAVVVVVVRAGRRARSPASPLVEAALFSVDTSD